MMARTMNGPEFSRVVRAGALAVVREQEVLDRINVFPVCDADTGANLAATLRAAASRLGSAAPDGVAAAARVAADGALEGARGNSGAIFAQFLHGLAGGMDRRQLVDGPQFADAARSGMESAYAALQDPREGTILSVLRAWSQELVHRARREEFGDMMLGGLAAAREALADTPRQLEVLARHRVVDAGGQGFVFFLEGIIESLRGGRESTWLASEAPPHGLPPFSSAHVEVDDTYRFCAEVLLAPTAGAALSREVVMDAVKGLGGSLVVAGGHKRLRVHVHTNEPQRFLAAVAGMGVVERTKIDDMVLQQLEGRASTLAIVTDSTTDLPEDTAFRIGAVVVPLTLSLGSDSFMDGVDITPEGFIWRIASGTAVPRSSQPAVADFVQTYRRLLEYREGIVSVHIAGAMSGTVQSASAAARQVDPRRIRVVDSCTVSVGTGLLVEAVGEAVAAGAGLAEVADLCERVKREIRVYGTVASLDYAVRGGRVGPRLARTLHRLHLAPIVVFDEAGKAAKGGVALGFDRALDAIARRAVRFAGGAPARAMVVHSGDQAGGDKVAARLVRRFGAEVPVVRAGAVLTTHVGPGSVSVAVRRLPA